jgi:hypothetical protein
MVGVATAPSSFHHQEPAQRGQEQAERREPGPFGFVRTREDHCENGQTLRVLVLPARSVLA